LQDSYAKKLISAFESQQIFKAKVQDFDLYIKSINNQQDDIDLKHQISKKKI
jgi:hypothetical protein